jgi:hypothetical protein
LNKQYHGSYRFTDDRGTNLLYTYAFKRTAPLTKELLSVTLLSIPGERFCRSFYEEACREWMWDNSNLAIRKRNALLEDTPDEEVDKIIFLWAFEQILSNPIQYFFLTSLEGLKMFFWESTKVGFVYYPPWLLHIHDNIIMKNGLRGIVGLLALFSTFFAGVYIWKNRRKICDGSEAAEKDQYLFFVFFFLILFISLYALVMTLVRYSLPIAPLFIAVVAFTAQQMLVKNKCRLRLQ